MAKLSAPRPSVRLAYERFMANAKPMRGYHWLAKALETPAFVELEPDFENMSPTELTKAIKDLELKVALDDEVRLAKATKTLAQREIKAGR